MKQTWALGCICIIICIVGVDAYFMQRDAMARYEGQLSVVTFDRSHIPLSVSPNSRGHYALPLTSLSLPDSFSKMLIQKEDQFFYYHLGLNPFSALRTLVQFVRGKGLGGSSTITQQLAKNLLQTDDDRSFKNKFREALYAVSMELFHTKKTILTMYANTVFLGNQVQGFETGSYAYFNKPLKDTTENEQLSLLATLSYPSTRNPWGSKNSAYAEKLHEVLHSKGTFVPPLSSRSYTLQATSSFELATAHIACPVTCTTSIDTHVTEDVREILGRNISAGYARGVRNGAVVIIDPQRSELVALVGSPDPQSDIDGHKINMAIEPRPIGSTIKPFLYLKGFMEGLRPYTLVEDREYKFPIATGFSLYPKNYDGKYRGIVTLHEALSNSLNVPSVQILSYIGLTKFYAFLDGVFHFKPIQPYESYQYGIALGGLEMDLLTLTHYFTLFSRGGTLAPLKIIRDQGRQPALPPQSNIDKMVTVAPEQYVELVQAIISDRLTGVNQFGLNSTLNLTTNEYGVKTGTSRDFHDSWVVGYTKDFVVGVWIGNSENTALAQVSGQSGAGAVWHDVMEYLLASPYNKHTPLTYSHIKRIHIGNSDEWGLANDDVEITTHLLEDKQLILSIHNGDVFELTPHISIPLKARTDVQWSANGENIGIGIEIHFKPTTPGTYEISAFDPKTQKKEIIPIQITAAH